ncbi:hypothetical protein H8D04_00555 [bacterium]|nr:hypothetical protein [bacterium]
MKLTKTQLREIIREELLIEGSKISVNGKNLPRMDKLSGATIKSVKRVDDVELLFIFDNGRKMIIDIDHSHSGDAGEFPELDITIK